MSDPRAFYAPTDSGFSSSELTRGPWDGQTQHAGPPAALLAREIERCPGIGAEPADRLVGRITFEILRPVPIGPLLAEAAVERPGRRVDMVAATLRSGQGEGKELVRARAWRVKAGEVGLPDGVAGDDPGSPAARAGRPSGSTQPPPGPHELTGADAFFSTGYDVGYHTAMEYRFAQGGFLERGPAICWMRMGTPLLEGEEPSPLQRVLVAADSGNGISVTLDFERYLFINVDLTVHLHRMPAGEWVCLDSITIPERNGLGISDTLLADEVGPIGRACQTLLIAER